ncbi:MAG: hypothetical protein SOR57_06955 [Parabacteroides sp.]|nr:hypothetical protein [Parabacteroides sp.]
MGNKINSLLLHIYIFFLFILFLNSMFPWYIWNNISNDIVRLLVSILSITLLISSKHFFTNTQNNFLFFIILFFTIIWECITQIDLIPSRIVIVCLCISLVFLKTDIKLKVLDIFTKYFSIFIGISLFFYISFLLRIIEINPSYIEFKDYKAFNYYFFILPASIDEIDTYYRFRSIFAEPGHLTMGIIPMIMANKFNLKNRYVQVLFIAELFTFSLAGYITLFLGYFLIHIHNKNIWKYLLFGLLFIISLILILEELGYSDMLNTLLWDRLKFSNGTISGDNRVTAEFEIVYDNFINSQYKWYGNDLIDTTVYGGISGIKKYLVMHGIIGVIITSILYSIHTFQSRNYNIFIFSIILLLLLFQNAYPFWTCILSMYILGVENLKRKSYV